MLTRPYRAYAYRLLRTASSLLPFFPCRIVAASSRHRPLFQTATQQWRALSSGKPISPSTAYTYIKQSLRQTTPFIIGAMRLLASTYTPKDLNFKGFSLYADFRPEVNEWGKRGEVRCKTILDLRNKPSEAEAEGSGTGDVTGHGTSGNAVAGVTAMPPAAGDTITNPGSRLDSDVVKVGNLDEDKIEGKGNVTFVDDELGTEPNRKKTKVEVDEPLDEDEYDAAFDDLGDVDLQHLP